MIKIEKKLRISMDQLKKMGLFKIKLFFLLMIVFSCNDNKINTEKLLFIQYEDAIIFYKKESESYYLCGELKSIDYPYLESSFDSIKNIKNEFDIFFKEYPTLKKEQKLNKILKTRSIINKLTNSDVKFIDINMLSKCNDEIFDKGIVADFSKLYYKITSTYCLKHANKYK